MSIGGLLEVVAVAVGVMIAGYIALGWLVLGIVFAAFVRFWLRLGCWIVGKQRGNDLLSTLGRTLLFTWSLGGVWVRVRVRLRSEIGIVCLLGCPWPKVSAHTRSLYGPVAGIVKFGALGHACLPWAQFYAVHVCRILDRLLGYCLAVQSRCSLGVPVLCRLLRSEPALPVAAFEGRFRDNAAVWYGEVEEHAIVGHLVLCRRVWA